MHHKPNTEIYGEDILGNRCHQTLGQNQKYITIFTKEKKKGFQLRKMTIVCILLLYKQLHSFGIF